MHSNPPRSRTHTNVIDLFRPPLARECRPVDGVNHASRLQVEAAPQGPRGDGSSSTSPAGQGVFSTIVAIVQVRSTCAIAAACATRTPCHIALFGSSCLLLGTH